MAKTWADVERTFQDAGINYQLRNWFYLCQIEGRQFYYSPKTGKWRLKRKRFWQLSQNTIDFIAQAKEYLPPENQKKSSNNQRTRTKQKSCTSREVFPEGNPQLAASLFEAGKSVAAPSS